MEIKKDLQRIYESISGEFSASRVFTWHELQVFIPYIKDGFKVLDLGCGNGRILQLLKQGSANFEYLGVDFSKNLIERAKEKFSAYNFRLADMSEVEFGEDSFDIVLMIASFHHLETKTERLDLLNKIYRWLKPGGYLFMTNWNLRQKKYIRYILKNFWRKRSINDFFIPWKTYSRDGEVLWRYYHSFTKRELKNLLIEVGFKLEPKGVYKTKWNINCFVRKAEK